MEQKFKINKTAVYNTYGDAEKADTIIFALHGYGQLSKFFIRKFHAMPERFFIVAPEGFHRFYLNGTSGRVGASWMTKENRTDDIDDYIEYLSQLWNDIQAQHSFKNKILLGFSQGGATASRWLSQGNFQPNKFILWAGVFPPDMNEDSTTIFKNSDNVFVVGNEDPYFPSEKIAEHIDFLKSKMPNFTNFTYQGAHSIDSDTLLKICK